MANDDVNSASSRYNQVGASASLDEIYSRTRRMSEVNTVAGERLRQEGRSVRQNLRNLREANSLFRSAPASPEFAAAITQNRDEYAAALEQRTAVAQNFYQESQIAKHRSGQFFQSQINQFTGPRQQATRINEGYGSSQTLDTAARQMNSTGYGGFERMQQEGHRSAREAATNLRDAAMNGASESQVRALGGALTTAESQIGVARRGMQLSRQAGQDPQSQFMHINEVASRAADRVGGDALRQSAAGGGLPSLKELDDQISAAAKELSNLKEEFASGKKPLEDFNKEAGAVADKLTKLEQQERAVQSSGGGMRENMGIARAGIDMLRQTTVNQPIQALNIKGQMAAAQNDQYATVKSALGGDMSALGLLGSGVFGNSAGFARQQQLSQKILQTGEVAATGVDAAVDVGLLNLKGAAKGAIGAGSQISNIAQGVMAGETSLQSYNAAMNAQKQVLAVPSQFRQSFFDYGMNVTTAGRQMGGRREAMTKAMMNIGPGGFMQNMADIGVDANMAAGFAGQGAAEQGSAFSLKQIGTARNLERGGFGTMEESMRRMSALANTGGANDPNTAMGRVMEEAVSKGMDSSKAISLMSDGISHLAQTGGTAALGVDATQGITALLGRALGGSTAGSDVNRSAAAMSAINSTSEKLQDTSVSYTNMVRNTRLRQSGMSGIEAANFMKLSAQELGQLQAGGPEAERLANERGFNSFFNNKGQFQQNKAAIATAGGFLEMGGQGGLSMMLTEAQQAAGHAAITKRANGGSLNTAEAEAARTLRGAMGSTEEAAALAVGFGGGIGATSSGGKASKIMNGTAPLGAESIGGEAIMAEKAKMNAKEIKAGSKDMENLDAVSKVLGAISKAITPETMERFAGAASKAADDMKISSDNMGKLNIATGTLSASFDNLAKKLDGLNTNAANIGGFKTGANANKPLGPQIKQRIDKMMGH